MEDEIVMKYEASKKDYIFSKRRFDRKFYKKVINFLISSGKQYVTIYPEKTYKNDIFQRELARFKTVVKESSLDYIKVHEHYDDDEAINRWVIVLENTLISS